MQVSVIIVNYKNPPLILQCVKSILQYEKTVDYEIIVVDNDSQDDTEQQLRAICPNLKWIQMGYNSGFGRANNAGTRIAKGDFILFLNADTILIEPVFEKMATRLAVEPKIGAVG
ncbi:MAG: glycosyltransferase, partial [Bacteroidales bacterium]|nr:glycosyltransferase [Bacteroidales bacterium]